MRQIAISPEPSELATWRLNTPGVGYSQVPSKLRELLKESLLKDQRGLCAYTGIRIEAENSHVEHLIPQTHCKDNQDIQYSNMVACYPAPDQGCQFGAKKKDCWPDSSQTVLFVSPRSNGCEARFQFDEQGRISPASVTDNAAGETIEKLGLGDNYLVALRKTAIKAVLLFKGIPLDKNQTNRKIAALNRKEEDGGTLDAFSFALKQVLNKHLLKINRIQNC
jgi:uncharacterized protein (TIGR02646 family)